MQLVVQPSQRVLNVQPGANLLEVLRDHQVPMSYSCMAGRCGTCRCKVVTGNVLENGKEVQRPLDGRGEFVLACQTFLTQPCTIEIPEPDEVVVHPARIAKAKVAVIEDLTHDIKRLVLTVAKPMEFSPGQYVQLQFTPEHSRPYSMATLCDQGDMEFHVRVVPDGLVSNYIARELKVGDTARVSGPLGTAYLRRSHVGPILCMAGGTGLAPILSILRGAVAAGMHNPIHLYFGARSAEDVYGIDWLRELDSRHPGLRINVVTTVASDSRVYRSGLVTQAVEEDHGTLAGWRVYLCGSPPMVEAASVLVRNKGVQPEHIHADAFYYQGT